MAYKGVRKPVTGPPAFKAKSNAAALSRSAVLLLLGRQLRGDDESLVARNEAAGVRAFFDTVDREAESEFPVPKLRLTGKRFNSKLVKRRIMRSAGPKRARESRADHERKCMNEAAPDLAQKMYEQPTVENAASLMESCLQHDDELTCVCAAAAYYEISDDPIRIVETLVNATRSRRKLVKDVASIALARIAPEHPRIAEMMQPAERSGSGEPSHTSLLVHGTFASSSSWWQPGGDFHTYIKQNVKSDLYSDPADRFEWSGGYSDGARDIGAQNLLNWVNARQLAGITILAHSHGANIAMLATQLGMEAGDLILLSCPVHFAKYSPAFDRVNRVISIRVKYDLVILADFGGQTFTHPRIEENVLPIWSIIPPAMNPTSGQRMTFRQWCNQGDAAVVFRIEPVSQMLLLRVALLTIWHVIWKLTRLRAAGRRLVLALAAPNETTRTVAGIYLVRTGKRAVPILLESLHRRKSLPIVLTILGDIGDRSCLPALEPFTQDSDPDVSKAARRAIELLQ